jgi:hypothetical protein
MGFGYPLSSSPRYEMLGRSGGAGTAITAGSTANTKGSYTTLGTTSFNYDGIWVSLTNVQGGTAQRGRIDIAVNNGGSDQIVCEDLYFDGSLGGSYYNTPSDGPSFLPVKIPKGGIVKARAQSSGTSGTFAVTVQGVSGDGRMIRGARALKAATDWTNTDPANGVVASGTSLSGWSQVQASTPNRFSALYVAASSKGSPPTLINFLVDIGWGGSGSERVLFSVTGTSYTSVTQTGLYGGPHGPWPCDMPAGTRLAARVQSAYAGASGTLGIVLYGLAA